MPEKPTKLRKQYTNKDYPEIVLRFEDGHEINVEKGKTKSFDCYAGERIKIMAIWDESAKEWEKVDTLRAEQFDNEKG